MVSYVSSSLNFQSTQSKLRFPLATDNVTLQLWA